MNHEKMLTSEFAKLCQVDKKTLFYYDDINLLKPAGRTANGYRYYTMAQYDQMSAIKILQSSGLSLDEIKDMLHLNNYDQKVTRLQEQLTALNQKIDHLIYSRNYLQKALESLQHFIAHGTNQLLIEERPESYYFIQDIQRWTILSFLTDGYEYGVIYDLSQSQSIKPVPDKRFRLCSADQANYVRPAGQYVSMYQFVPAEDARHHLYIDDFLKQVTDKQIVTIPILYYESSYFEFLLDDQAHSIVKLTMPIDTKKNCLPEREAISDH